MTLCLFASQIVEELAGNSMDISLFASKEEEFISLSTADNLHDEIELLNCRIKARAYLEENKNQQDKTAVSIERNMDLPVPFNPNGKYNVITIPVPMHSATCKPLFFDLYADCINYPNMESRIQTKKEEKKEEKKGWFSGWW